jgi:hypothetical protein
MSTANHFKDRFCRLIYAWEDFERRHLRYLEPDGKDLLRNRWQSYSGTVQGQVSELKYLHMLVLQKLESFKRRGDGVSLGFWHYNPLWNLILCTKFVSASSLRGEYSVNPSGRVHWAAH